MNIYHYDALTGECLGSSIARLDPIGQEPLIPANATPKQPISAGQKKVSVYDSNTNSWSVKDDYRGTVWFDVTGNEQKINEIGIAPDPSWTDTKPFILSSAITVKNNEIRTAFEAAAILPLTDQNNVTWNGGYTSASKINGAIQVQQMKSKTTVDLFDIDNVKHTLSIADAQQVALLLGDDYQVKFAQKQAYMIQAATAQSESDLNFTVAF
jgi:hypothetical protein